MTILNKTSFPIPPEDEQKGINFDNTDGATKDVWVPLADKRAILYDVVVSVVNKQAGSYIIVGVQVFIGGSWRTLLPVAAGAQSSNNFSHNFGGRIHSAAGDGTARVRVGRMGTSTSWESQIIITGKEV